MSFRDVELALDDAHRQDWGRVLAATVRVARNLDLAEECVQEAYAAALVSWARDGIPLNPAAWLTTIARRRAVDVLRREGTFRSKLPLLAGLEDEAGDPLAGEERTPGDDGVAIFDERLRLIFLCCHPALSPETQIALTLRLVCGMSTGDISRAFLVSEATMAARLTRGKHKIAGARIPFRVPTESELPERLATALGVIYLLFTGGHAAPSGTSLIRVDLMDRAVDLARAIRTLVPEEAEATGLLSLLLATHARRGARTDEAGHVVRLEEQNRAKWDWKEIEEARSLLDGARTHGQLGPYGLQAAIGLEHAVPSYADTDWQAIVALYDDLFRAWPSPVVALNRAVAVAMAHGPDLALSSVERLEEDGRLSRYHYLYAVKAELLRRLGREKDAAGALRVAARLAGNDAERAFLDERLSGLEEG